MLEDLSAVPVGQVRADSEDETNENDLSLVADRR